MARPARLSLLGHLASKPKLLGPVGSGLVTKLALNQLIASLTHASSLSLHLLQHSGGDVDIFMELLRGSALYAPTFDKKLAKLLSGDGAQHQRTGGAGGATPRERRVSR